MVQWLAREATREGRDVARSNVCDTVRLTEGR
jgi:hypothetical protein